VRAKGKRWTAKITYDSKQHNLGYFDTKQEAALAYDRVASQCGEDKPLNYDYDSPKAAEEAAEAAQAAVGGQWGSFGAGKACESAWRWLGLKSASSRLSRELDRTWTQVGGWGAGSASLHQGALGTWYMERGHSLAQAATPPPPPPPVGGGGRGRLKLGAAP
jgi:hypothetical protein